MATFIDSEELQGNEPLEFEEEQQPKVEPKAEEKAPELPEKYRGKSVEDIVRMHQEAEKLIGKQAQEVGEVRKLTEELLKQQLSQSRQEPTQEETEVDFFADPKGAVKKAVDNHPDVLEAKRAAADMKAAQAREALLKEHPDMPQVVQSPEFIEWVKASKVRVGLYVAADQNMDTDAANELLSTFKALNANKRPANTGTEVKEASELRQNNLRAASVDASGTGEAPRKIYRSTDLIRLRMEDPERYNAMHDEIIRAYAEKRVK